MPFTPLVELDPVKLHRACTNLCRVFGVPSLRVYQTQTGENVLKGISTFLDIPTGGGKTLAYWLALFYYWEPGNTQPDCQKIILAVGPLTALMESQALDLTKKGVPAIALTSNIPNLDLALQAVAANKFRIVIASPELAVTSKFHTEVLSSKAFTENIICQVIDEGHCISEWGNDDFRPDFSKLAILLGRLPSGLPIIIGSATMPRDVYRDIIEKLRLRVDCARISVSNAKPNVALSVRILRHPQDTFADLMTLFQRDSTGPLGFPQTLVYANSRIEVERIQDFFRRNCPADIDEMCFKFYHRFLDEEEKLKVQKDIENGSLRGVATTDALGMGMDFRYIMRVILWLSPLSFLSLVQKIGRCVRLAELLGEAILYVTSSAFMRFEEELEILMSDASDNADDGDLAAPEPERAEGEQMDRDAALEANDEAEERVASKKKFKKLLSAMEARDRRFLLEYIVTRGCRRIPWNKFFGNDSKLALPYPVPANARCCDNCSPDLFPVETVRLIGGLQLKAGRRRYAKATEELIADTKKTLKQLREDIVEQDYPDGLIITGKIILSDTVIEVIALHVREITSLESLMNTVRWHWAPRYGSKVVAAIEILLVAHPDLESQAREEEKRERALQALEVLAEKDLRKKLLLVFDGCHQTILDQKRPDDDTAQVCQIFKSLPRKTVSSSAFFIPSS
ncbi:P-loop containing nucleoside triphosphate hydrolase protein [Mycena crocata]|nr:P-loop containing nucleoside triphosphate hydrolase protein [Mycena crocata]